MPTITGRCTKKLEGFRNEERLQTFQCVGVRDRETALVEVSFASEVRGCVQGFLQALEFLSGPPYRVRVKTVQFPLTRFAFFTVLAV